MPDSQPTGPSGDNTPDNEPELLDINGNPIPRNWDPAAAPAPPDAEPPTAKPSPRRNSNGTRPAAPGSRPPAPTAAPRPAHMPGEEERFDLAGKPLPPLKASLPPPAPAYASSGSGPARLKSGGGNPLGPILGILLVLLIAGAGYVLYTKYAANPQKPAKPVAASAPHAGAKTEASPKKPFGGTN